MRHLLPYWHLSSQWGSKLLRRLPPEAAHRLTIRLLKQGFGPVAGPSPSQLGIKVWQHHFPNPIGIAAGFDKHAEAIAPLSEMGFGFVEIGGVTPKPQPGNKKPRVFRLPNDAIANNIGLASVGASCVKKRLVSARRKNLPAIIGINLAKNTKSKDAVSDYLEGIKTLGPLVDFVVINISCPNVSWSKSLDTPALTSILKECRAVHPKTLLVKLAPNLSDGSLEDMLDLALTHHIDGLIVGNTLPSEQGGVSGSPLKPFSQRTLHRSYALTKGKIPLIACGGIDSAQECYDRIRAGACLVQLYTALVYQGPLLLLQMKQDLCRLLARDGFSSIADAVGTFER